MIKIQYAFLCAVLIGMREAGILCYATINGDVLSRYLIGWRVSFGYKTCGTGNYGYNKTCQR